jgi:hypothetical protein
VLCLVASLLFACNNESQYNYVIQMENGRNLEIGHPIYFLGIHVGSIKDISFGKIQQKDYVFAEIELKENNILQKNSTFFFNNNGFLEFVNLQSSELLAEKDTLLISVFPKEIIPVQNNSIKPLEVETIFDSNELENLSKEEKEKLDSLENKIQKLNQLIKEINDEN